MKERGSKSRGGLFAAILVLPLAGACVSQQTLDEYEQEILTLREEKASQGRELRSLRDQLADYEIALGTANERLADAEERATQQASAHSDLEDLGVGVGTRGGNLVFTLPNEITFASGSATLTNGGRDALQAVARTLREDYAAGYYWIEGHTDSDPISKSAFDSNRALSLARAMAVLTYLVEDAGISDDNCVVAGHGEYLPVDTNDTQAGKARNRRVEIVIHQ